MRSLPEVTLTTRAREDTSQVQAGDESVVSVIVNTTGWPAYAVFLTDGVATTSLSEHVPDGLASGVGVGEVVLAARPVPAEAYGVAWGVSVSVAAGVPLEAAALAARASGPPEPPVPRSRAMPKTSAKATTTSRSRRVQYTR